MKFTVEDTVEAFLDNKIKAYPEDARKTITYLVEEPYTSNSGPLIGRQEYRVARVPVGLANSRAG